MDVETCGHINIRGMFSDPRRVPLVNVEVKMCGDANCEKVADGLPVVCAIAPLKEVTDEVVLPIDVVNIMSVSVFSSDVTGVAADQACNDSNDDDVVLIADQLPVGECVSSDNGLRELQEKDGSLSAC